MPKPTQKEMRHAILEILKDGKLHKFADIFKTVSEQFALSEEEKEPIYYQLSTTASDLKKKELINNPEHGSWKLVNPEEAQEKVKDMDNSPETQLDDKISDAYAALEAELRRILLEKIGSMDPYKFEHLVGDLFTTMGYEVSITKGSGDGGIDGVIEKNELKEEKVCFQVKKYKIENLISIEQMKAFAHDREKQDYRQGIFITTSDFAPGAKKIASDNHIALINREKLVTLLIKYNIGVKSLTIKTIDQDYKYFKEESNK